VFGKNSFMGMIFYFIVIDSFHFVRCHEFVYTVSKCSILRLCYAICLLIHIRQERKIWYLRIKFSSDIRGSYNLRHRSASACLLEWRFRIPPGAWISVPCECCVLLDIDLCVGLMTLDESYRLWCV
jgi:hypothetical protein